MAWKETDVVRERARFVVAVESGDESFAALCRRFGISRPTGYKWLERYESGGPAGLDDRPSTPNSFPHRLSVEVEDRVVALRKERPTWGPKKLRVYLSRIEPEVTWPAASTIGDVLSRRGLVRPRRRRLRTWWAGTPPSGVSSANEAWAIDFKGHFAVGSRYRCHPLTVTDVFTRYLLKCEALSNEKGPGVRVHLERAFREFGLPERIRSDNGPPFSSHALGGLCPLAVWLIQLGIFPERIQPRRPDQNGSHERMHLTLKQETTKPPRRTMAAQQRAFDAFRADYNAVRPHEALMQRTPDSIYNPSTRPFPGVLKHPEYPSSYLVRSTDTGGVIHIRGKRLRTAHALHCTRVGLKPLAEDCWQLFYGPLPFGFIDARNEVELKTRLPPGLQLNAA